MDVPAATVNSELVGSSPMTLPKELSPIEKMNLTRCLGDPTVATIFKLMEIVVNNAQIEAIETDPADEKTQRARMTEAHAMRKFYKRVRDAVEITTTEHVLDVRQKLAQEELKDRDAVEKIILSSINH